MSCSCVSSEDLNELAHDEAATSNSACNSFAVSSESHFTSLRVLLVSALTFRRLVLLRPRLHRQFVMSQQLSDCEVKRVHQ